MKLVAESSSTSVVFQVVTTAGQQVMHVKGICTRGAADEVRELELELEVVEPCNKSEDGRVGLGRSFGL